jgi:hypothetical protein
LACVNITGIFEVEDAICIDIRTLTAAIHDALAIDTYISGTALSVVHTGRNALLVNTILPSGAIIGIKGVFVITPTECDGFIGTIRAIDELAITVICTIDAFAIIAHELFGVTIVNLLLNALTRLCIADKSK